MIFLLMFMMPLVLLPSNNKMVKTTSFWKKIIQKCNDLMIADKDFEAQFEPIILY